MSLLVCEVEGVATEALTFTRRLFLKSLSIHAVGREFLSCCKRGRTSSGGVRSRKARANAGAIKGISRHSPTGGKLQASDNVSWVIIYSLKYLICIISTMLVRHGYLTITLSSAWGFCLFPPTTSFLHPLPAPEPRGWLGSAKVLGFRQPCSTGQGSCPASLSSHRFRPVFGRKDACLCTWGKRSYALEEIFYRYLLSNEKSIQILKKKECGSWSVIWPPTTGG